MTRTKKTNPGLARKMLFFDQPRVFCCPVKENVGRGLFQNDHFPRLLEGPGREGVDVDA